MKPFICYQNNILIALNSVQYLTREGSTPQYIVFTMHNGRSIQWHFETQSECDAVYNYIKEQYTDLFPVNDLDFVVDSITNL